VGLAAMNLDLDLYRIDRVTNNPDWDEAIE
jgi:hypothetical protein